MPAGAPFESHIPPYSQIRVDLFSRSTYNPAWINLLSHVHSDHIQGLAASSFCSRVVCSENSKRMLLLAESTDDRINYDRGLIPQKRRTFASLKSDGKARRDLLLGLPLNTPTKLEIGASEIATITLLDANHCPGAVMFLVEGRRGAVLHTGDIRAEPAMVARLAKNRYLAPYHHDPNGQLSSKKLECIYLDTASMLGTQAVPSKAEAIDGLVKLIELYPQDTQFFINAWTWGYEDIFLRLKLHFNTQIHVDRYKYTVLSSLDSYMSSPSITAETYSSFKEALTCDASSTRFHACERFNQCDAVKAETPQSTKRKTHRASMIVNEPVKRVVYINPGAMAEDEWKAYTTDIASKLQRGQFVDTLRVPLLRHSTLAELQSFIAHFRPKNIFPNTLIPHLDGLDWACLPGIFADCLSPDDYETLRQTTLDGLRDRFPGIDLSQKGMELRVKQVLRKVSRPDSDHDNAVGSADHNERKEGQAERLRRTQEHIGMYLPWLFRRQDTSPPEPNENSTPKFDPRQPSASTIDREELCTSCAHCPTCGPRRQRNSSRSILADQTSGTTAAAFEAPANTTPLPATEENTTRPHRRNGHANPPPSKSAPGTDKFHDNVPNKMAMERPSKMLRLEHSQTILSNPQGLPNTSLIPATPLLSTPQTSSLMALPGVPQYETMADKRSSLPHATPNANVHAEQLLSSKAASRYSTASSGPPTSIFRLPAAQSIVFALPNEGNDAPNSHHAQGSKTIAPSLSTTSQPSSSISSTTREHMLLCDSDRREQRRVSKLKERQIRNQLAKLPPEFSQSLAATKSTSQARSTTSNADPEPTRNALVQRIQSGEFGPLDLDLGCVRSQSQGKGPN